MTPGTKATTAVIVVFQVVFSTYGVVAKPTVGSGYRGGHCGCQEGQPRYRYL